MASTDLVDADARGEQRKVVIEIVDRSAARAIAGALTDLLMPAPDALTLFEEGERWRIEAYYDPMPDLTRLHSDLAAACDVPVPPLRIADVPLADWVRISQAALPPVTVGRFTIHGSHDHYRVPTGPNAILIDAGEAFGTAHHATTQGCLIAIDRLTRQRRYRRVLDLGCGSGVLAIAVARALPQAHILASDLDAQSIIVARANMRANRVGARIAVFVASGLRHRNLRAAAPYDLLIANILAGPLINLATSIRGMVAPGGALILSGILTPQAAQVVAAYVAADFCLIQHDRIIGWSTLEFVRS